MKKEKWIEMGYQEVGGGEFDTLFKKFDNENMYVVQYNLKKQEDEVGIVYLTKEQIVQISK